MKEAAVGEPAAALESLAGCRTPFLVGVRHHSPALAAAVGSLLDRFRPERLLVELPAEFQPWLEWLSHPALEAPVALAGAREGTSDLAFYPFANFSPELAALRWARERGVPAEAFDLPVSRSRKLGEPKAAPRDGSLSLLDHLLALEEAPDFEALWDRAVEARAPSSEPEGLRRAGLLVGWALRADAAARGGPHDEDLAREAYMRERLGPGVRAAAVIGAFHAPALLPEPLFWRPPDESSRAAGPEPVTSLLPYSFELLDSRSGYPAGIRDPLLQERLWEALRDGTSIEDLAAEVVASVARELRRRGHAAGVPDSSESLRMSIDLARLRGLPSPGRREILEGVETALGQGELLGRGRVLARALDRVLVGRRRGRLPPGAPRSGLAPHVEGLLAALSLPGPGTESREPERIRLDPLRSQTDRSRHVLFHRLRACGVPYANPRESAESPGDETLTEVWDVGWTPATEGILEVAGTRGATLEQAASGALAALRSRLAEEEKLTAAARLELLEQAAASGLPAAVRAALEEIAGPFLAEAGLPELLRAHLFVERLRRGHLPGLPPAGSEGARHGKFGEIEPFDFPPGALRAEILAAAVRALEGIAGSGRIEDARAVGELVRRLDREDESRALGDGRLGWILDRISREGSPLVQGAAWAARVLMGREAPETFGRILASWLDPADSPASLSAIADRIRGVLAVAGTLFEADPLFTRDSLDRVAALDDPAFLHRLPALREGFEFLSPAARQRLLELVAEQAGDPGSQGAHALELESAPEVLASWAAADRAGREAVLALDPALVPPERPDSEPESGGDDSRPRRQANGAIGELDRWRLILGRERERLPRHALRAARALEDLYGSGRGEGSRSLLDPAGGREESFPSVREWAEEIEAFFGKEVREEVLGRAAERGRRAALLELDPQSVTPSVELLERVLSLRGGLPESQVARLRPLVRRVVDHLVRELSKRLSPALAGLATPRPTRRRRGPLDLSRTVRENLRTCRRDEQGAPRIAPERPVFRTRARRSLDWRVILVVDVSGSMEASVIYSAIVAAILASLPAVRVNFLAFSTEVVDLSDRVDDPLSLLLEISVGGGTHIAKAIRHARELATIPARTLVPVVTDFEEGYPVGDLLEEVRALVETGARPLGLAALDDRSAPRYSKAIAEQVVAAGMPVAALTPMELARWIGERIRG